MVELIFLEWNIYEIIAGLLIFGLIGFFTAQIYAWTTGPKPSKVGGAVIGSVFGALVTYLIYLYVPLAPALLGACISGVYSWQGYLYALGILGLIAVFTYNMFDSWSKNRPLEILQ